MKYSTATEPSARETKISDAATDLPWPRTWPGVYLFVIGSFLLWIGLLVALTEYFS
jgi:hypothetical protein